MIPRRVAAKGSARPTTQAADSDEEPDQPVAKPVHPISVEEQTNAAWDMLNTALTDTKPKAEPVRIDAITCLGYTWRFPPRCRMVARCTKGSGPLLRLAAVAAMGSSKKAEFVPDLKQALNDNAPGVSFTAAVGLWKMNDRSGESILDAVLAGSRKANRGLATSEKHEADQDLHSPSKLAQIGAEQGAYALLGPFGMGLPRCAWARGGAIHPKVIAVTLLADDTSTASMQRFVDALDDPDPWCALRRRERSAIIMARKRRMH